MPCMHPNTELRIEERTHRLAEEQRAKGKPTISRYLTKEQFLDRAAELGWVYDDDRYLIGTLYDTFADDPENVNVLMSFTRSEAWTDYGRRLCINGLEKGLSSESITDEQREKINEALNRNDWKNIEFDDDALSDIFEDRYGIRYESFEGVIDPFNRPYNKILTDTRVYKTLIDADIAEQKELARKNSFANDYTKNDFIEGYRRKGRIADADDDFFGTVYDELSEVPDGKALLIDMMNIPAWEAATQKKQYVVQNYDDVFIVEGSEVIEYLNTDGVQETEKLDDFEVENEDLIEEETPIPTAESTGENTNDPEKSEIKKEGIIPLTDSA